MRFFRFLAIFGDFWRFLGPPAGGQKRAKIRFFRKDGGVHRILRKNGLWAIFGGDRQRFIKMHKYFFGNFDKTPEKPLKTGFVRIYWKMSFFEKIMYITVRTRPSNSRAAHHSAAAGFWPLICPWKKHYSPSGNSSYFSEPFFYEFFRYFW